MSEIRAAESLVRKHRDRYEQAIHNILVAIGREHDLRSDSMSAAEWVRTGPMPSKKTAKRLDAGGNRAGRKRGAL